MITPTMSSEVAIGRRMNGSEMFTTFAGRRDLPRGDFPFDALGWLLRLSGGGGQFDLRAGLQLVLAIDHHLLTGRQSALDHRLVIFRWPDLDRLHPDGFVRLDHVGVGALRSALHHARGHDGRVFLCRQNESRIDKFSRPQFQVLVRESGLQLHRAGRLIDLVIDHGERAFAERCGVAAIERGDGKTARLAALVQQFLQILLRHGEDDRDRFQLRDDDDAARIGGVDDVADIDQPKSRASVDRRFDLRVIELRLRALDRGLIGLDGRVELPGLSFRSVEILFIDHLFFQQIGVARERRLRVGELGLVLAFLADRLIKRFLKRARIDLRQQVTGFDVLPSLKSTFSSGHPRASARSRC